MKIAGQTIHARPAIYFPKIKIFLLKELIHSYYRGKLTSRYFRQKFSILGKLDPHLLTHEEELLYILS